ncbi:nucleotidyltransferase family protein [Trichloromonas sp.]|uniref:nucleotidyltransferase family protein n=1 Tax=Trichloromonas sp. TaxID=3069249 RepID=UPI002A381CDC|nr:nucleotidyltransferase domain-containing protein [Trichloromonas sp.]
MKTAAGEVQLSEAELVEVYRVLRRYAPKAKVWAFGSRVRGGSRPYSDLDLAIEGRQPLSFEEMADLTAAFDEADLAFKVDLVDWATVGPSFRRIIEEQRVLLLGE